MHETLEKHLADAGPDVPFRALRSGDVVGIYCGYADEKAALAGEGGAARAIGASPAFKSALAELQQPEPVVVFYADVERGIAQVNEAIDKQDDPEPKEAFGPLERLTFQEVGERIKSGEIRDSCTISALMLAQLAGVMQPLVAGSTDRFGESEQEKSTETGEPAESLEPTESLAFGEPA